MLAKILLRRTAGLYEREGWTGIAVLPLSSVRAGNAAGRSTSDEKLRRLRVRSAATADGAADPKARRHRGLAQGHSRRRLPQRFAYLGRLLRYRRRQAAEAR